MSAGNWRSSGGPSRFTCEASEWPTFLHLDIFDEEWSDLALRDDDLQELQIAILASPERYPIIPAREGSESSDFPHGARHAARAALIASDLYGSASSGSSCW
jgi:hypothetical protein